MAPPRERPSQRKTNSRRRWRPATSNQLWRLNTLGRLQVVEVAETISAREASQLIDEELAKTGEAYFADTKLAARLREEKTREVIDARPFLRHR